MPLPIPGLDHLPDETIFNFCSNVIFIPWIALILAPKWNMRRPLVYAVVLIQCIVYAASFAASFEKAEGSLFETFSEMGKLEGVTKLFSNDAVILPAWVHYLAFDLLVGNYLVEKNIADPAPLAQVFMFPALVFTCLCGPVGVLVYAILRLGSGLVGTNAEPDIKAA